MDLVAEMETGEEGDGAVKKKLLSSTVVIHFNNPSGTAQVSVVKTTLGKREHAWLKADPTRFDRIMTGLQWAETEQSQKAAGRFTSSKSSCWWFRVDKEHLTAQEKTSTAESRGLQRNHVFRVAVSAAYQIGLAEAKEAKKDHTIKLARLSRPALATEKALQLSEVDRKYEGEVARIQSSIEETKAAGEGSTNLFKLGTFEGKLKEVRAKITAGKSKVETLFEKAGEMKVVLNTKAKARRASRAKGKAPTAAAAVATSTATEVGASAAPLPSSQQDSLAQCEPAPSPASGTEASVTPEADVAATTEVDVAAGPAGAAVVTTAPSPAASDTGYNPGLLEELARGFF